MVGPWDTLHSPLLGLRVSCVGTFFRRVIKGQPRIQVPRRTTICLRQIGKDNHPYLSLITSTTISFLLVLEQIVECEPKGQRVQRQRGAPTPFKAVGRPFGIGRAGVTG